MKTLIIYYSDEEKTKLVVETLARELNCYICQIKDLKDRKGLKNRLTSTIDAFREVKTEIYPSRLNLEEFDTIYFGTPTWANKPAPAITTIIDRCDLKQKDIILFSTMTSSGGEKAIEKMEEKINSRGGRVIESFTINIKEKDNDKLILNVKSKINSLDLKMYI